MANIILKIKLFSKEKEVHHPTWSQVLTALSNLDGFKSDQLEIEFNNGKRSKRLIIGGGEDNLVTVGYQEEGQEIKELQNQKTNSQLITQSIGGQESTLPASCFVSKAVAQKAAEFFYKNGSIDNDLGWV